MNESYGYLLKDVGEPKSYLRAVIIKQKGVFGYTRFISIKTVEERCWVPNFQSKYNNTSAPTTFHR